MASPPVRPQPDPVQKQLHDFAGLLMKLVCAVELNDSQRVAEYSRELKLMYAAELTK